MGDSTRSRLARFGIALLAPALALFVRWPLWPLLEGSVPYLTFFLAIMAAAYYGGFLAGLLATALSAAAADYFLLEPLNAFTPFTWANFAELTCFILTGFLISALCEGLHRTQRRAEASALALRQNEARLRVTLTSIADAVIVTDEHQRVTFLNEVAQRLTGWSQEEAAGQLLDTIFPIAHEQTRERIANPADQVMRAGHAIGLGNDTLLLSRNGQEVLIDESAAPIRDERSSVVGVVLVFRDVTQRRHAEAERARLLAQEQQARAEAEQQRDFIRLVLERAPLAVLVTRGPEHRLDFFNSAAASLLGLYADDVRGRPIAEVVPETALAVAPLLDRVYRCGTVETVPDLAMKLPLGRSICLQVTYAPLPGPDGKTTGVVHLAVDLTQRKQAEEALQRSQDLLKAIVDNSSAAIYVKDLEGRYLLFNRSTENVMMVAREKVLGKTDLEAFPREVAEAFRANDQRVLRAGKALEFEETGTGPDGPFAAISLKFPLKDRAGNTYAVCGISTFITDRKRLEAELQRRAAALAENDRRKDEFLAMLGHELRNPLAPIRSAVHLLRGQCGADSQAEQLLGIIERQTGHMARLVDNLLDVSRITRGKVELQKESINLSTVVQRALETVRPLVDERRHQVDVQTTPEPIWLEADPSRLEQVLANLLNNAAKYTEEGGRIGLTLGQENGCAVVRVRDNGIGIRPEMLPRIFEMFTQADSVTGRLQEGLGIGLTLVRSLVELHGGSVTAHSFGPGKGSQFVVRLPLSAAENVQAPEETQLPPRTVRPLRILCVDDNVDGAQALSLLLQYQGHEVRVANDGPSALQKARTFLPEVVLLDIGMPGMSGYEVAIQLRQIGLKRTLVVAVTGFGQEEDRKRSREAGIDDHLVKPVDISALHNLLSQFADRSESR
jgi:PAS domain S-box-containing protein